MPESNRLANSKAGIQIGSVRNPKHLFFSHHPTTSCLSQSSHVSRELSDTRIKHLSLHNKEISAALHSVYPFPSVKVHRGSLEKKAVLTSKNKTFLSDFYRALLPHCKSRVRSDLHCWKLQKRYSTPAPGQIHYELLNCSSSNSVWGKKKKEKNPIYPIR